MVAVLREADATSVAAAAKKHKIGEQTIYAWRKHFGELAPSDVKRLRTLEAENARLKRLLAPSAIWTSPCSRRSTQKMLSPQARREQVEFACERGLSERRASSGSLMAFLGVTAAIAPHPLNVGWAQFARDNYRPILASSTMMQVLTASVMDAVVTTFRVHRSSMDQVFCGAIGST